ncbi:MAG: hypothetical protein IKG01_07905 [Lachnospiraceae bacterium]|nr:hypothetical protein [Lachnospiraceae bacterium]
MGSFKDKVFESIRADYVKYRKESFLYKYIFENELSASFKRRRSAKAVDEEVRRIATERLYDIGYPIRAGESKRKGKNTALEILDAYVVENGLASGKDSDDFEPEPYADLFNWLNDNEKADAFIPVQVDATTGIGFYIIGKNHYDEFPECYKEKNNSCGIGFMIDWESRLYDKSDMTLNTGIVFGTGTDAGDSDDLSDPPNIQQAYSIYKRIVLENKYQSYREFNGNWPEKAGLSDRFIPYFNRSGKKTPDKNAGLGKVTLKDMETTKRKLEQEFKNRKGEKTWA